MAETAKKSLNLKELSKKPELLTGGHRLCAGCTASVVMRQMLLAAEDPVIISNATGCLEVATTIYPYSAWLTPWIHSAFENSAATITGVESMYNSLKRQGKLPVDKKIRFIALGGDGGTYDIGLQSLSGALERGHNFTYICYDNGAYMNTGIQRSSASPLGADTTTTPAGKVIAGKQQYRKDLTAIVAAHNIPYLAQASPSHWRDLMEKVRKALNTEGPAFLNVIAPCHRGWRCKIDEGIELARSAVETCFWPLYEIADGKLTINYKPRQRKPLQEWMEPQGRFNHLFKPENAAILERLKERVKLDWHLLLDLEIKQKLDLKEWQGVLKDKYNIDYPVEY
ncbi:MAG: pyruvate ferredoxin oxidoreductase [Candidatus Schekmanbacteria bacterium]|nr:pyruvate ferredoxin oxidoreductase [Candidatus Schekmanbacteria bacterium]